MNDKKAIVDSLFSRRRAGIKPGLERMENAVSALGHPERGCQVVHVAGTNGKGSTATMVASGLRAAGNRVGLFTSPHILEFRERYCLDGVPVSDEQWIAVWLDIEPLCDELELTFFEISALLAFELFKRAGCDYAVIEVGLGGRLDATNVVDPAIAIITALAIEHTEYLGDTLELIAMEKLGIVKAGRPFVVNSGNKPVVFELAARVTEERNAPCTVAPIVSTVEQTAKYQCFSVGGVAIELPLWGAYQVSNCAAAVTALQQLGVSNSDIQRGIASAALPARMQLVSYNSREILFDVAHNPQALEVLVDGLAQRFAGRPLHFLIGMMKDKDCAKAVGIIEEIAATISCFTPSIPRSCPAEELAAYTKKGAATVVGSPREAVERLGNDGVIVVTGSFYTVADAMNGLEISPYREA